MYIFAVLCMLLLPSVAWAQQTQKAGEFLSLEWVLDEARVTLTVVLQGERSSGYSWRLSAEPEGLLDISEGKILEEDSSGDDDMKMEAVSDADWDAAIATVIDDGLPGAGWNVAFTITPAAGRTAQALAVALTCSWERSWIEGEAPAKVLALPLRLAEDGTLEVTGKALEMPY